MRVLWLAHFLPYPSVGHGALQRSHHLLLQLAAAHETGLVTFAAGGAAQAATLRAARLALAPRLSFMDVVDRPSWQLSAQRIDALLRTLIGPGSYWEYWFSDPRYRACLQMRIATFRPDLLYVDTAFLARYAGMGLPLAVTHHNVESALLDQRAASSSGMRRTFWQREAAKARGLERRVLRGAKVNIAVSADDAATFHHAVPEARLAVVPNGVDVGYFGAEHAPSTLARSLVFAGGMDWYPNRDAIEWCVEQLWPLLLQDGANWRMTVVGRHPPVSARRLAEADHRFRVTGFVDDVRPFVTAAAAYICPIRVGGGTRLKILDALAMRRPLVSTRVGVSGLGLKEGEHYLGAETAVEFLQQLRRLDSDPALAARLAFAGHNFVIANYAWDTVGQVFVNALQHATLENSPGM